jgi:hypothetical protein
MSETFLARWSRRKHAAAREPADAASPAAPAAVTSGEAIEGKESAEGAAGAVPNEDHLASAAKDLNAVAPPFDPASLPPIESIAADTDIRAFLAPGVPPELARAALRRAWAADPKIRDFIGLADYDWDFNAPGSMAGFGPLEMTEELREVAARIIGPPPAAEPSGATEGSEPSGEPSGESPLAEIVQDATDEAGAPISSSERRPPISAAQNRSDEAEKSQIVVRPRHGGALPK